MDDLCDLCHASHVSVSRTTYCGKTIGIECGCDDSHEDGSCGDRDCEECNEERVAQAEEDAVELRRQGKTHAEVCEELNRLGYHTRTSKRWRHPQQIIKLMRSFGEG